MENDNIEVLTVPVLPLRGLVVFPGAILHFDAVPFLIDYIFEIFLSNNLSQSPLSDGKV